MTENSSIKMNLIALNYWNLQNSYQLTSKLISVFASDGWLQEGMYSDTYMLNATVPKNKVYTHLCCTNFGRK